MMKKSLWAALLAALSLGLLATACTPPVGDTDTTVYPTQIVLDLTDALAQAGSVPGSASMASRGVAVDTSTISKIFYRFEYQNAQTGVWTSDSALFNSVDLIRFGNKYYGSVPIYNPSGYILRLTKFLVADDNNDIIYAIPTASSTYGNIVSSPLPHTIDLSNQTQPLVSIPQLLAIGDPNPVNYGYPEFSSFTPYDSVSMGSFTTNFLEDTYASNTASTAYNVNIECTTGSTTKTISYTGLTGSKSCYFPIGCDYYKVSATMINTATTNKITTRNYETINSLGLMGITYAYTFDLSAPAVSNKKVSHVLGTKTSSKQDVTLNWTKATDNVTPQANLEYMVTYKTPSMTNAATLLDWTANTSTVSNSQDLYAEYTYRVYVRDAVKAQDPKQWTTEYTPLVVTAN